MQNISIQSKCSRDDLGTVWVKLFPPPKLCFPLPETTSLKGLSIYETMHSKRNGRFLGCNHTVSSPLL